MSLDPNSWTEATQQLFVASKDTCIASKNAQVEPIHFAVAAFDDDESLAVRVAQRGGANADELRRHLRQLLMKLPQQDPAPVEVSMSHNALRLLQHAQKRQKATHEAYLGIDHVLLAMTEEKDILQALAAGGLSKDLLEQTLQKIKGSRKTDTKGAEGQYDALSKYGVDLVQQAADGKLDPVLGGF